MVGTGGYVCSPLMLAAVVSKIPILLHEQNAFPGRSNRLFARFAKVTCVSFAGTENKFVTKRVVVTGNPIKPEFFHNNKSECRKALGIEADEFVVLLLGGSLGAQSINKAVVELASMIKWQEFSQTHKVRIVLATGQKKYQQMRDRLEQLSQESRANIQVFDYLNTTAWLPAADAFVGRSGASACFEACATGVASLFVPYPYAAGDHQTFNAERLAKQGAAEICVDAEFNGEKLFAFIERLNKDKEYCASLQAKAKSLAEPEAAAKIAQELRKL